VKKYLVILLGILFILSFTVVSYAQDKPEITLGGKLLMRGWYFDNINTSGDFTSPWSLEEGNIPWIPAKESSSAFYSTNVNLSVDVKVTDNVRGFVELETASGTGRNSGLYYWGNYDTKPDAHIRILKAWIQYTGSGLLGVPAGIKVGHMPLSLGEKQFVNNDRFGDDAILVWVDPTKELHIAGAITKLNEGGLYDHTDDLDGYILMANYMLDKDNTIGAYWVWLHSDGYVPALGPDEEGRNRNVDTLNFHDIGLHANGGIYGLKYNFEADYQFGKAEEVFGEHDADFNGWAVYAKLGYTIDPVNIRASFAYGSGDDDGKDNDIDEFQTLLGPDYGLTARLTHYTQIYERTIATAAVSSILTTRQGGNWINTGIANTTYYNLGFDVDPLKELSISVDGYYLRASENGAWEDVLEKSVSKNIGWEVDSRISYKIAKNLTYFVEAAYFKPGSFYKDVYETSKRGIPQVVHGLSLTF